MVQIEDRRRYALALVSLFALSACGGESSEAATDGTSATTPPVTSAAQSVAIRLWAEGQPAFGIFVPSERPRGERGPAGERPPALYTTEGGTELGRNDLLDYLFLNLEGSYDAEAISAISSGLGHEGTSERQPLLVRIPPISADCPEAARARGGPAPARGPCREPNAVTSSCRAPIVRWAGPSPRTAWRRRARQ